ncbi:MAG: GNAT family N-acetyltransferase [Candidatus Micrarchaeota archaeon]
MPTLGSIRLEDGRIAEVSFLSRADSTGELLVFINRLIAEKAYILLDKKLTLAQEEEWKKGELEGFRKKAKYTLIARIGGKIAASSHASCGIGRERESVMLGLAVVKPYRRLGLGEALLRFNINTARKFFRPKPKNIWLSVLRPNRPAYSLYKKVGFREFAVWPKWIKYNGKYLDSVVLKL